jgi:hypothetical protein
LTDPSVLRGAIQYDGDAIRTTQTVAELIRLNDPSPALNLIQGFGQGQDATDLAQEQQLTPQVETALGPPWYTSLNDIANARPLLTSAANLLQQAETNSDPNQSLPMVEQARVDLDQGYWLVDAAQSDWYNLQTEVIDYQTGQTPPPSTQVPTSPDSFGRLSDYLPDPELPNSIPPIALPLPPLIAQVPPGPGNPSQPQPPVTGPEFNIVVTAFVPGKYLPDPVPWVVTPKSKLRLHFPIEFAGDNRGFGPTTTGTFRGRQEVTVVTGGDNPGLLAGSEVEMGGMSIAYKKEKGHYKEITSGQAISSNMHISLINASANEVKVQMQGSVVTPLVPGAPPVQWNLTVDIQPSGSGTNAVCSVVGTRTMFPALEVDINNTAVVELPPRTAKFFGPYGIVEVTRALNSHEDVKSQPTTIVGR